MFPSPWFPSLKENRLVMTGMAEWGGCGVWGVWGVGRPGILNDEEEDEEEELRFSVAWSRITAVQRITPWEGLAGSCSPCTSSWKDQLCALWGEVV